MAAKRSGGKAKGEKAKSENNEKRSWR